MTSPEALLAHAAWVERLAQRLVRDDAQAADVVQETWLQALRKPPAGGPTRAWLGTVLRNTARRSGRKEQDRLHAEREGARAETQPDVQAVISRAALSQEVVGDVLALEEPYRSVVLLRWFEDLGPSEIARKLDRPVSTVKTQLQRGHEHLRQRLAERHGDECWGLALLPLLHPRRSVPLTTIVAVLAIAILAALAAWRPWQASSPDGVTTSLAGVGIADQPLRPAAGSTRASSALRIVDPAGRPISALPIRLVSPRSAEISPTLLSVGNNEPKVLETETDAQGVPVLTEGDTFTDDDLLGCTIEPNTPGWMLIGDGLLPEAAEQSRERRCVIARTTEVTGIVRGMDGTGLPRARLSVQVRRDALPRLPYRLDPQPGGALGQTWESWTMAGDDGRYAFEVPAGPDFLILAHADGHTGLLQPAPGAGKHTPTLDFDLLPRTDEGRWVAGFVLDEDSGPVAGALVDFGYEQDRTDARGRFRVRLIGADSEHVLTAFQRGRRPAVVKGLAPALQSAGGQLDGLLLCMRDEPLTIRGHVRRADGSACVGWFLTLRDGTPFGSFGSSIEHESSGADGIGISSADDGSFTFGGLMDREYELLAHDEDDTYLAVVARRIRAGTQDLELLVHEDALRPRQTGTILDARGNPLAGHTVGVSVDVFWNGFTGMSGQGRGVTADDEGRFVLENIPWRDVKLAVWGPDVEDPIELPFPVEGSDPILLVPVTYRLDVRLPKRGDHAFELHGVGYGAGAGVLGLDRSDVLVEPLEFQIHQPNYIGTRTRCSASEDGRRHAVHVTGEPTELVWFEDEVERARIPIHPTRGAVLEVDLRNE
ncbi:MAG: sigma-70 family RNA polymerase sigma factor [Planctomycetota bacterium]|nr:sigma-70 family RNA polymerase sigma factor [Planctomycetota bacterium]